MAEISYYYDDKCKIHVEKFIIHNPYCYYSNNKCKYYTWWSGQNFLLPNLFFSFVNEFNSIARVIIITRVFFCISHWRHNSNHNHHNEWIMREFHNKQKKIFLSNSLCKVYRPEPEKKFVFIIKINFKSENLLFLYAVQNSYSLFIRPCDNRKEQKKCN